MAVSGRLSIGIIATKSKNGGLPNRCGRYEENRTSRPSQETQRAEKDSFSSNPRRKSPRFKNGSTSFKAPISQRSCQIDLERSAIKPWNFPDRKNSRRRVAFFNLTGGTSNPGKSLTVAQQFEYDSLVKTIVPSRRHDRSKKMAMDANGMKLRLRRPRSLVS